MPCISRSHVSFIMVAFDCIPHNSPMVHTQIVSTNKDIRRGNSYIRSGNLILLGKLVLCLHSSNATVGTEGTPCGQPMTLLSTNSTLARDPPQYDIMMSSTHSYSQGATLGSEARKSRAARASEAWQELDTHSRVRKSGFYPQSRGAILALRCEGYGWTAILEKVANCSPSAVKKFVERVLKRADCDPNSDPENLVLSLLLQYIDDPPPAGREERFPEYGEVANEVVRLATLDKKHEDMLQQEIIRIAEQTIGERIPYTTRHRIFKKREIVKRAPPQKIHLNSTY
ncbi:hypothetical protein K469DRAFT_806968 [Zopfia rhizophila CBS 207.26]|uniref:Uncharacterized protein n=1 Tax=Zopfia rhizophila CBS 207.26 TaxID=1314779 RepID=A0A6A6DIC4_9PEZI|nr:hypothetical protein K469DRAFT_806968 [Zopfia rhizophila CBS 207.26]